MKESEAKECEAFVHTLLLDDCKSTDDKVLSFNVHKFRFFELDTIFEKKTKVDERVRRRYMKR